MLGNALKCAALVGVLASVGVVFAAAEPAGAGSQPAAAAVPFERLKSLAGEWVAAEDGESSRRGTSSPATP